MIKVGLQLLLLAVVLFILYFLLISPERPIIFWDYPYLLEAEEQVIEVSNIRWACACPEWAIKDEKQNRDYISECDSCIFLESANNDYSIIQKEINKDLNIVLRLKGKFYKTNGISRDYESPTSEHPKDGRVFRYTHFEIVKEI